MPGDAGQDIYSLAHYESPDGPVTEAGGFVEGRLSEAWAVGGTTYIEVRPAETRSEAGAFVKRAIWADGPLMAAAQAGAVWSDAGFGACAGTAGEAAALIGAGWARGFASLELGARGLGPEGCAGARGTASLGFRPGERTLILGQAFYDEARDGATTTKLQVSAVLFAGNGWGLQAGARARVDGEEAEPALTLGLWRTR